MAMQQSGVELIARGASKFISDMGRAAKSIENMGNAAQKASNQANAAISKAQATVTQYERRVQTAEKNARNAYGNTVIALNNLVIAMNKVEAAAIAKEKSDRKVNELIKAGKKYQDQLRDALEQNRKAVINYDNAVLSMESASEAANKAVTNQEESERKLADASEKLTGAQSQLDQVQQEAAASGMGMSASMNEQTASLGGLTVGFGKLTPILIGLGAVFGVVVVGFKLFTSIIGGAISIVETLAGAIKTGLVGAFNLLSSVVGTITAPIRNLISSGINELTGSVGELIGGIKEAVPEFQKLQVMFLGLSARDLAKSLGISTAEAFNQAQSAAEDLFNWIKKIAVTTPFTAKSIATTLAMANAMGLTIGQAEELTTAVGNFTAGMGLTDDHMYRIIYNFGQMFQQGKLTGREFRDLAVSFVPMNTILEEMAKEAGKTKEAYKKLAFEGGVPVEEFFKKFISYANTSFPGAMERMAKTWEGLTNNAKDFVQVVLGMEAVGPVFNRITAGMAAALQNLIVYTRPIAQEIGRELIWAFERLQPAAAAIRDAINQVADSLGWTGIHITSFSSAIATATTIIERGMYRIAAIIKQVGAFIKANWESIISAAKTWGYNFMVMIANGMAAGVSLITNIINQLASLLDYWLGPGSAPRAFPKLPQWGMHAMAEYLHGFTMVDFSVLEGIQGPLKSALDIFVQTGKITQGKAGKTYRDISVAIAKALSSGVIDPGLFDKIRKAGGMFGDELAILAQRYFDLAAATKAYEAAEKALAAAQKKENDLRVSVSKQVREYNKMIRAGADKTQLQAKLAQINATEEAARAATQERIDAEKLVEVTKAQVEALQEAVALQEKLVQQLLDITKEQIIDVDTSSLGSAAAAAAAIESTFEGIGDQVEAIGDKIADWSEKKADIWTAFGWLEFQQNLKNAQSDIDKFKTDMGKLFDPAIANLGQLGDAIHNVLFGIPNEIGGPDDRTASRIQTMLIDPITKFLDTVAPRWDNFVASWSTAWENIQSAIDNSGLGVPGSPLEFILTVVSDLIDQVLTPLQTPADIINFLSSLGEFASANKQPIEDLGNAIKAVADAISTLVGVVTTNIPQIFTEIAKSIITGLAQGITDALTKATPDISGAVDDLIDAIEDTLGIQSPSQVMIDLGQAMMEGLKLGVEENWSKVSGAFDTKLGELTTTIQGWIVLRLVDWIGFMDGITLETSIEIALTMGYFSALEAHIRTVFQTIYYADILPIVNLITAAFERLNTWIRDTLPTTFSNFTVQPLINELDEVIEKIKDIIDWANRAISKLEKLARMQTDVANEVNQGRDEPQGQFGRYMPANNPALVGEAGSEVFIPRVTGMVVNQRQMAHMMRIAASSLRMRPLINELAMQPVQASPIVMSTVNNTIAIGPNYINNGMDLAIFEARVKNIVREEFS